MAGWIARLFDRGGRELKPADVGRVAYATLDPKRRERLVEGRPPIEEWIALGGSVRPSWVRGMVSWLIDYVQVIEAEIAARAGREKEGTERTKGTEAG